MAWGTFDDTQNVTPGPDDWDKIYFAGEQCPGVAKVVPRLASDIDDRRQAEVKKSFVVDKGTKPVRVNVEISLLMGELADYYARIIPLVAPRGKSTGQVPLEVSHPALLMYSLSVFIVEDLEQAHPKNGIVVVTLSLVEYEPAPKKLKASKAKTADAAPANDNPTNPKPSGDIDNLYK